MIEKLKKVKVIFFKKKNNRILKKKEKKENKFFLKFYKLYYRRKMYYGFSIVYTQIFLRKIKEKKNYIIFFLKIN